MSITDELREWWVRKFPVMDKELHEDFTAIADRIDTEHEAKVSYWQDASYKDGYDEGFASADDWLAQHEDAMAEHGWIRLPKDADGEYIRIGDVMEWPTTGETFEVVGIGEGTLFYVEDGSECADWTGASTKRHYHAPTVEDVLEEFGIDWEHESDCEDRAALLKEYAKRLRLVNDEE